MYVHYAFTGLDNTSIVYCYYYKYTQYFFISLLFSFSHPYPDATDHHEVGPQISADLDGFEEEEIHHIDIARVGGGIWLQY